MAAARVAKVCVKATKRRLDYDSVMSLLHTAGRAMLSAIFIKQGIAHLQDPAPIARAAEQAGVPEPELAAKVNSAAMLGGGAMLALGLFPRAASLILAGTLVPATVVGHAFWDKEGAERQEQETQFFKNLAIFGGLLALAGRR